VFSRFGDRHRSARTGADGVTIGRSTPGAAADAWAYARSGANARRSPAGDRCRHAGAKDYGYCLMSKGLG